jgi:hypothetical protein
MLRAQISCPITLTKEEITEEVEGKYIWKPAFQWKADQIVYAKALRTRLPKTSTKDNRFESVAPYKNGNASTSPAVRVKGQCPRLKKPPNHTPTREV